MASRAHLGGRIDRRGRIVGLLGQSFGRELRGRQRQGLERALADAAKAAGYRAREGGRAAERGRRVIGLLPHGDMERVGVVAGRCRKLPVELIEQQIARKRRRARWGHLQEVADEAAADSAIATIDGGLGEASAALAGGRVLHGGPPKATVPARLVVFGVEAPLTMGVDSCCSKVLVTGLAVLVVVVELALAPRTFALNRENLDHAGWRTQAWPVKVGDGTRRRRTVGWVRGGVVFVQLDVHASVAGGGLVSVADFCVAASQVARCAIQARRR
eukprot:3579406-Prymnesium_polylepis.3